ncbi:ABC transporter substrate-binding protein [Halomarina ordinaria]|uniref:ABC transporter substrate-binding protein n=1 Tax=Halomarina ordinaria TaxID=3033939 RepID=A0ABD5UEL0_9EURY|nr:ABC transporter substrate-binding protein [Halomarina sp. PSRA2]
MADDATEHGAPTRREYVKYGGAVVGGGLLAGCVGQSDGGDTPEATSNETEAETETTTEDTSYEACIEPVGCQTFEEVPETYLVYNGGWADMAFALGQRDGFITAGNMIPAFLFEPFDLDVPAEDELPPLRSEGKGWDKELFFEYDPDVILMSSEYMHGVGWYDNWDESDTEEIADEVAPFFGNNMRRRREFHDHELYSLYEGLERLAVLFQEEERYEAMAAVHDELQSEIQSRLPPEDERPEVALVNGGSEPAKGTFYPMNTQDEGYEMKPYRDLDVESAFSEDIVEGGEADYETLLEVDPAIIMVHWGIGNTGDTDSFSAEAFREQYVAPMEDDSVGSQLTAVQEGNVYPGQYGEQGPLVNLLQTEMVAQQLYPEEFGAFAPEEFPDVPEDRRLFDRQRVRDIITGDI